MDIQIQWENQSHFLLHRDLNKNGISIDLFKVAENDAAVWFDPKKQIAVPIKNRNQTSFEVLTIDPVPALLVLSFRVGYQDHKFDEQLLSVVQLLEFKGGALRPVAWLPVLPEGAVQLSVELPKSFDFTRKGAHPLIQSTNTQGDQAVVRIATSFLDITSLWWKAIESNSKEGASLLIGREKLYLFDVYNRWYKDTIDDTGCRIAVLASTASVPPLIWFVLVPERCRYNIDSTMFSQVYYRPAGWRPEGDWRNNISDIIGKGRVKNILATLLWSIMSPVKVLEESRYKDRKLTAFISDRFKVTPKSGTTEGFELRVMGDGLWAPQRIAASLNESGTCQLLFFPIRHDVKGAKATQVLVNATAPDLHERLRLAVNVLWTMGHAATTASDLRYDDHFVVAGYSLGGFSMWLAAENNIQKVRAIIAVEPGGVPFDASKVREILDSLIRRKRKIFFVGRYKTHGDMGAAWANRKLDPGITYLPAEKDYDDFFAHKPLTTTNQWLRYVFTGLRKRDDEKFERNSANKEPHPEPDISLAERKAINALNLATEKDFVARFPKGSWFGIPVLHLFAMCGGRIFTAPKVNSQSIVTEDAAYKTFYQECLEAL